MTEQVGKLFGSVAKWAPAPTLGIAIACTLVIFLPSDMAQRLGVAEFRTERRGFLGWSCLLAWSYLLAALIWHGKDYARDKIDEHQLRKLRQRSLHELTAEEKGYLSEFMRGCNTIHCEPEDGIAGGLVGKNIIYSPAPVFDILEGVPYNIQPWAKRYLQIHPELRKGAKKRERPSQW